MPASQHESAGDQLSYRGQLEQAYMNGQISGIQYQQAINQHMVNQQAAAAQRGHNRQNGSTGGPDQASFSQSLPNASGMVSYPGGSSGQHELYEKRPSNPSQFEVMSLE